MSVAIKIENLSKQYQLGTIGTGTLSHDLNRMWSKMRGKEDPYLKIGETNDRTKKGKSDLVWALKDINFEVQQGEILGIIGKNGAGKSTLLKILSKVTGPTTGSIKARGRIASLLEVGTGFHPELTGRENIFLNGAILGMTKFEIRSKLDEIVDFAGVERYLDTPVKRYSSGMMVRLGFAVAAHLEPEILVVDEVLAVGDAEFQKKAIGKMQDVSTNQGRTVLFVSHNMASIKKLCDKALVLKNGSVGFEPNETSKAISFYISNKHTPNSISKLNTSTREGNMAMEFTEVTLIEGDTGNQINEAPSGSSLRFRLHYKLNNPDSKNIILGVGINNEYDERIAFLSNEIVNSTINLSQNKNEYIDIFVEKIPLTRGLYNLTLFCSINGVISDWLQNAYYFNIIDGDFYNTGKNAINGIINLNYSFN